MALSKVIPQKLGSIRQGHLSRGSLCLGRDGYRLNAFLTKDTLSDGNCEWEPAVGPWDRWPMDRR